MREISKSGSPPERIEAIEANMFDFWRLIGRSPQVDLYDGPDMIRLTCDVPTLYLNNVLRVQLSPGNIDTEIKKTLSHFKLKGLPVRWMMSPSTQPADLGDHLEAHGLVHVTDFPGMAVQLTELNEVLRTPIDFSIEHVRDEQTLKQMVDTFAIGYEIPDPVRNLFFDIFSNLGFELPLRHYLGWYEEKPVGCSSLFLSSVVAGIYGVATVQEARGLGVGTALTLLPLLEARELGYRIGVLGSTEMGLGVYRRLGFREYFKFVIYIGNHEPAQTELDGNSG
jgi:GNAT superfamily N-acetyltransferase